MRSGYPGPGLLDYPQPFRDARGVYRIDGRKLEVMDVDTQAPVENVAGMIWGPGKILMDPSPNEGLFTPEHFDRDKDYLVVVVECPHAVSYGRRSATERELVEQAAKAGPSQESAATLPANKPVPGDAVATWKPRLGPPLSLEPPETWGHHEGLTQFIDSSGPIRRFLRRVVRAIRRRLPRTHA